jgi:hypothetical protein
MYCNCTGYDLNKRTRHYFTLIAACCPLSLKCSCGQKLDASISMRTWHHYNYFYMSSWRVDTRSRKSSWDYLLSCLIKSTLCKVCQHWYLLCREFHCFTGYRIYKVRKICRTLLRRACKFGLSHNISQLGAIYIMSRISLTPAKSVLRKPLAGSCIIKIQY